MADTKQKQTNPASGRQFQRQGAAIRRHKQRRGGVWPQHTGLRRRGAPKAVVWRQSRRPPHSPTRQRLPPSFVDTFHIGNPHPFTIPRTVPTRREPLVRTIATPNRHPSLHMRRPDMRFVFCVNSELSRLTNCPPSLRLLFAGVVIVDVLLCPLVLHSIERIGNLDGLLWFALHGELHLREGELEHVSIPPLIQWEDKPFWRSTRKV